MVLVEILKQEICVYMKKKKSIHKIELDNKIINLPTYLLQQFVYFDSTHII